MRQSPLLQSILQSVFPKPPASLCGHTDTVQALAVTADGKVISGSADKTLKVWNLDTGQCLKTLQGHTNVVAALTVIADGRVVSGSHDGTLKVWNIDIGECIKTLEARESFYQTCSQTYRIPTKYMIFPRAREYVLQSLVVTPEGMVVNSAVIEFDYGFKDEYRATNCLMVWDIEAGKCVKADKVNPFRHDINHQIKLVITAKGRVSSDWSYSDTFQASDFFLSGQRDQNSLMNATALAVTANGAVVRADRCIILVYRGFAPAPFIQPAQQAWRYAELPDWNNRPRSPVPVIPVATPTQPKQEIKAVTQPSFQQPVVTREGGQTKEVKQEDQIKTDQSLLNHVKNNDPTLSHASEVALPTWVPSAISSSALSLDTDQQKRLIDFLKVTPDFVTRCELAQVPKRAELSYALATDAEKKQQVEEQHYIALQPVLQGYYLTFQRIMNQTFIAALAIHSEFVKSDAGATGTALNLVKQAVTTVADAVPGLGIVTNILSALIEKGLEIRINKQLARLVSIAPGPAQMEQLIERIARQLTLQLESALQQQTEQKTFPLWDTLKTFYREAKKQFIVELAETLQQRQAVEDALQLLKAVMQEDKTFDRNQDFVAESVCYLLALKQNEQKINQKKEEIKVTKTDHRTTPVFQSTMVASSATPSIKASSPAIPVQMLTKEAPQSSYAEKAKVEQLERQLTEERAERQRMQQQFEKLLQHFNPNQDTEISAGNEAFLQQNVQRITSTSATLFGYSAQTRETQLEQRLRVVETSVAIHSELLGTPLTVVSAEDGEEYQQLVENNGLC